MSNDESTSVDELDKEEVHTSATWGIAHQIDSMSFVGRDVLAVAQDVYIIFLNMRTFTESVFVVDSAAKGDGVDCVTGHRSNVFAFAEKVSKPRILVCSFPTFCQITELKDPDVNRYKSLCMGEGDLITGFSGFPNYTVSVWSWRTSQRLVCVPTGIVRRRQIYMSSRTHSLLVQSWGEGLAVWEVAAGHRHGLLLRRAMQESDVRVQDVCWTAEGHLYAIDSHANLYSVNSDGIGMVKKLEWSENLCGVNTSLMCSFGNGIIIYGPDGMLRYLKIVENEWQMVWSHMMVCEVSKLVSNASSDVCVSWTRRGHVYRIMAEGEDNLEVHLVCYKQRDISKMQVIAPDCQHVVTINDYGELCMYEVLTGKLVELSQVGGKDVRAQSSPLEPVLAVYGEVQPNYGVCLFRCEGSFERRGSMCLTHQIVSRVCFSPTGRKLVAAAMSAGHIFILRVSEEFELETVRYAEIGRGLADCFLSPVGPAMRCFSLVLFSDKYRVGERIVCINAETGKDNKFAGKMQGPYGKLVPLRAKDTLLAIPHLSKQFHILKLSGEKGVTVQVKVERVIESGHEIKTFSGICNDMGLVTFGLDGLVILRKSHGPEEYELKLVASHRYEMGVRYASLDLRRRYVITLGRNGALVVHRLDVRASAPADDVQHAPPPRAVADTCRLALRIIDVDDKNWLDIQEERRVREEAMDYKKQREEVVATFLDIQKSLVALLEENLAERPLHQLPVSEFNLHLEAKRERLKQAADEREVIRQQIEATIVAQDRVADWIKGYCWDTMLTPRVKLYAIFSHYMVENYAVLPTQRDKWPELQQVEHLRSIEMEKDNDLFKPWEEMPIKASEMLVSISLKDIVMSARSVDSHHASRDVELAEESSDEKSFVLSGTLAHKYISVPQFEIPQMMAFSFLQMHWLQDITKLKSQNMRLWFNKEFDDLMNVKKREVGLVEERNRRLRTIISELNKLSDLRGSFHHLMNVICDPEWRQEEQPWRLIKVEPEEVSIEPYVSPSQVVIPPPEPKPKDDFKERALIDMMDGVLEKLWHEEIKKPIPKPTCMLEKEPEQFNEDDLRTVFEYEAKVAFRNEERDKYRKMLHAEFAKLSAVLNEGIVKFNARVKDMFITKLKVESVIGQENLKLMRLRRTNLDRTESAEELEKMRATIACYESEIEHLLREQRWLQEQAAECQSAYEAAAHKDRLMDRNFKGNYADLSPIVVDQCYRMFKKRPKWYQRASMTPAVLYEMAAACATGQRTVFLHADCLDYLKGVDLLDSINNMPPVMDEGLWMSMCKLRRAKVEIEIKMRAMCLESSAVESYIGVWSKAISARKAGLLKIAQLIQQQRDDYELNGRNKTIQLVLSAGLVEVPTSGRVEDYRDATLLRREEVETINNVIKKVGQQKLEMMRKHMQFRRGILAKEWEHAQMRMRLRHMREELYSYQRLKIPKELQLYLKKKEKGYTEEQDYTTMEREAEAARLAMGKMLNEQIQKGEDLEVKISTISARMDILEQNIEKLKLKLSEKRLNTDPMKPILRNQALKKRMSTLVQRSRLVRELQANHTTIVLLQTQLELIRLKTFPTLSAFQTIC